jgi:phosphoribulokinase
MSHKHPIIAVTGSAGAGTTMVRTAFADLFRREAINAFFIEGNSFRRYDRDTMKQVVAASRQTAHPLSHFGPETNLFDRLEGLFREYARTGTGIARHYIERASDSERYATPRGQFTPWQDIPTGTELLFYEGLHGGVIQSTWSHRALSRSHNPFVIKARQKVDEDHLVQHDVGVDVAQWVDLLIGVTPIINLEWIQKIQRDCAEKGASHESVVATILRRLEDYTHYITPQFSLTDINFQRVPLVDTSNPFIARQVPTLDESFVVVRFREPQRFNFSDMLQRIDGSFMSRPNTLVVPGGKMHLALEVICRPLVHELVERLRQP